MIHALTAYALVAAAVLGWLLNTHLSARRSYDRVPALVLIGLPLLWLPALAWMLSGFVRDLAMQGWGRP